MSLRLERVRELLKREIGEVIRRELPLDEAGLINVNDVTISSDLKNATVFIGDPRQRRPKEERSGTAAAEPQAHPGPGRPRAWS